MKTVIIGLLITFLFLTSYIHTQAIYHLYDMVRVLGQSDILAAKEIRK